MPKLFRRCRPKRNNGINLIGLALMIAGAIIMVINIPLWFWMSGIGVLIMFLGFLLFNQG
jgi:membrane-bound ClpP family serine protease